MEHNKVDMEEDKAPDMEPQEPVDSEEAKVETNTHASLETYPSKLLKTKLKIASALAEELLMSELPKIEKLEKLKDSLMLTSNQQIT
jgi:hypothetical protein